MRAAECKQADCGRTVLAGGFCTTHYYRQKRGRPMDAPPQRKQKAERPCSLPGCSRRFATHVETGGGRIGVCNSHYWRKCKGFPNWDAPILRIQRTGPRRSLGAADKAHVDQLDGIAKKRGLTRAMLVDAMCQRFLEQGAPL